ncbi:unnamed protein product [Cryptosporidium hominis]|uniref:Uncharacterized protein n=1 Tax=Cryptosporidium hominis TaxID=237895 RepID=A0A0S4TF64_CRYHO|nr:hypothetical protein [Cryptosporidium hominis TU502]OLQ16759.1 hypothetical protein ChTU502y2012_386g0170 [Cryptosporidium hominis]PPA63841.1 hypothetical protein ChUKH1_06295 [Cryptosporidium hominis]PPS93504.1 Uncharacterized protein GY17_00003607 [Cryptosporidium hominis]CUV06148.1 unnamed protein product [Cryptosporidium hominis]|eukprot:PPS93504.1 Uncharacterized protein GY17_00003607 [Cryptosporidium hominis]
MLNSSPEIKCLVKIHACSFLKNTAHSLKDLSKFLNISFVRIIKVVTNNDNILKPSLYSIYIPENPHIKPMVNEQLWVSSRNLLINEYLQSHKIDLINAGIELLKLLTWYLSWNKILEYPSASFSIQHSSPFQVCVFAPNLLLGCVMTYPYLIEDIPVTVLLCANAEYYLNEHGLSEKCLSLLNIINFSDFTSTTKKMLNYTRDLGFRTIIICPNIELEEEIVIRLALVGISENGEIVVSGQVEQLSSIECSILFQKRCTLSFRNQNFDPANWISNFVNNHMFIDNKTDILNNEISKMNIDGECVTKIENKLSFALVSNVQN